MYRMVLFLYIYNVSNIIGYVDYNEAQEYVKVPYITCCRITDCIMYAVY